MKNIKSLNDISIFPKELKSVLWWLALLYRDYKKFDEILNKGINNKKKEALIFIKFYINLLPLIFLSNLFLKISLNLIKGEKIEIILLFDIFEYTIVGLVGGFVVGFEVRFLVGFVDGVEVTIGFYIGFFRLYYIPISFCYLISARISKK